MDKKEYLDTVAGQIRSSKARRMAVKEIEDHISDQVDAYESEGMDRQKALETAVRQMGDPVTAGVELDRIHHPGMEWRLFLWILLFSALGLALQYLCFYRLGQMTALGCTMILALETLHSVLYNFGMGLGSTGGILFLSYGTCHTLVIYSLLGILLSVYRYRNLVWEVPMTRKAEKGVLARLGSYVIRVERHIKEPMI